MEIKLTLSDYNNLLALLERSEYKNMEEAEVGVLLKQKLITLGKAESAALKAAEEAEKDNDNDE